MGKLSPQSPNQDDPEATPQREPLWQIYQTQDAGALAVAWVVVAACVHGIYSAIILYGAKSPSASMLVTLTLNGKLNYLPERELPIYLVGSAAAVILAITIALRWRRSAPVRSKDRPNYMLRTVIVSTLLGIACSAISIGWSLAVEAIGTRRGLPRSIVTFVMMAPAIIELALLYGACKLETSGPLQLFLARLEDEIIGKLAGRQNKSASGDAARPSPDRQVNKTWWPWVDAAAVVLICFCNIYTENRSYSRVRF